MHVAVIGAGAAGLAAARHLLHSPRSHSVTVFERGDQLGGTWVFTERTGLDTDGRPVHSSMYCSLWTNLPKEVMAFPDYPFPQGEKSYLPAGEVLKYLNLYADHFGVRPCIKFRQHVERVHPRGTVWEVTASDVDTAEVSTYQFDSVMVCSGHYWKEKRPQLRGSQEFRGGQSHAHSYRRPDGYRGRRVLVIGAGPSGLDLALEVAAVAQQVILSHHLDKSVGHMFPPNVIEKPDVTSLTETGANFKDGTFCEVDDICYCTGYSYSFPFLTPDCGVQVEPDEVHPLFMQVVSVERPTLAFIGLPFIVCPFALFDMQVTVFERSDQLGGTWVYTPDTWLSDDGRPVYTSMYENLVTNQPKQLMTFPDFPFHDVDDSYVSSEEILKYLNNFADKFGIRDLIKFKHHVDKLQPRGSGWAVDVTDLKTRQTRTYEFDAVAVCTGIFWCPKYPSVEGRELFRGRQTHSHEYRRPEPFKGRRVLVVGGGPSGFDLALDISAVAEQVIISHHQEAAEKNQFPTYVIEKPTLVSLSEYTATFEDGTSAEIDDICYCTGYKYRYPFLAPECGVTVEDKHVRPLYHQVVHIDHPTMAFIGVPYYICPCLVFDVQAQLWVSVLDGRCQLPDPNAMRRQEQREVEDRRAQGVAPHNLAPFQRDYVDRLAQLAGAPPVPGYYHNMFEAIAFDFLKDLQNYRKNKYRIVDENNFEKVQ